MCTQIPKRFRSKVFASVAIVLVGLGLSVLFVFIPTRPSPKPVISITLLAYTNVGDFLSARVQIANSGQTVVSYNGSLIDFGPVGWLRRESPRGWGDFNFGYASLARNQFLPPGSNMEFRVTLPLNTLRWELGFRVRNASLRTRVYWKLQDTWFNRHFRRWAWWRLFPDKPGPEVEVASERFEFIGPWFPGVPWGKEEPEEKGKIPVFLDDGLYPPGAVRRGP